MKDPGNLYIFKNDSMPNLFKIGMTRSGMENRINSLNSTSLPTPFNCIYTCYSDHVFQLEKYVHRKLRDKRIRREREFFLFNSPQSAINVVQQYVDSFVPGEYTEEFKKAAELRLNKTASKHAKSLGLKSLSDVSTRTGVSLQTLTNWFNNKQDLFHIVCVGCRNISLNEQLRKEPDSND